MTHWYTRTMGNKFVQMSIGLIIKCSIKLNSHYKIIIKSISVVIYSQYRKNVRVLINLQEEIFNVIKPLSMVDQTLLQSYFQEKYNLAFLVGNYQLTYNL